MTSRIVFWTSAGLLLAMAIAANEVFYWFFACILLFILGYNLGHQIKKDILVDRELQPRPDESSNKALVDASRVFPYPSNTIIVTHPDALKPADLVRIEDSKNGRIPFVTILIDPGIMQDEDEQPKISAA